MPTSKKIFNVQNLAEKFKQAKALILADYTGLTVSQISELRAEIKKAGGELEVVKNTLLLLAAKESPLTFKDTPLTGPTAVLWIYKEDLSPLKALDTFAKKTELPKIKFGFWENEPISLERIQQLANLPTLAELQARLAGRLSSPIFGLINSLNWNRQKLVLILQLLACAGRKGGDKNGRRKENNEDTK